MTAMTCLLLAALLWVVVHIGVAGTSVRSAIAAKIGDRPFQGLFSLASILLLTWLSISYADAGPSDTLWVPPRGLVAFDMLLLLPALVLLVGSLTTPNPTSVTGGLRVVDAASPARGVLRVTRHPMLWSFAIWAAVHLISSGSARGVVFFGAILITALAGMPSLDAKYAKRDPTRWAAFAAATSIFPFVAIAQKRNRFVFGEIGLWRVALAIVLWFGLMAIHPLAFHVVPWAYFH